MLTRAPYGPEDMPVPIHAIYHRPWGSLAISEALHTGEWSRLLAAQVPPEEFPEPPLLSIGAAANAGDPDTLSWAVRRCGASTLLLCSEADRQAVVGTAASTRGMICVHPQPPEPWDTLDDTFRDSYIRRVANSIAVQAPLAMQTQWQLAQQHNQKIRRKAVWSETVASVTGGVIAGAGVMELLNHQVASGSILMGIGALCIGTGLYKAKQYRKRLLRIRDVSPADAKESAEIVFRRAALDILRLYQKQPSNPFN